jgi:hypothetical protein
LVLAGATALGLVVLLGVGIGLGLGGNNGQVPPTHDPYLTMPGPTPTPSDTPYPTIPGPTPTPSDTPYPTMPGPTPTPSATPAVQYFIGPLQVKRDAGSTTTLYTLTAMGMPTDATVTWSISAPCGSLAPAQFSAYASWQKSATKECPPGHGGPFPGEVTVTITTPRGSISFSAGSETATVGEQTAIP